MLGLNQCTNYATFKLKVHTNLLFRDTLLHSGCEMYILKWNKYTPVMLRNFLSLMEIKIRTEVNMMVDMNSFQTVT